MPQDRRDVALIQPLGSPGHPGAALPEPDLQEHLAARRLRLGRHGRREDVLARRLRLVLQHEQPAEPHRHRDQPAGHAARGHRQPDLPQPALRARGGERRPPGRVESKEPEPARLQPQPPAPALVGDGGHGRLRRLARGASAAQHGREHGGADPAARRDLVLPGARAAPEPELRRHRTQEERRQLVVQRAHLRGAQRFSRGLDFQSSSPFSRSLDTTQASTFFSDSDERDRLGLPEPPGLDTTRGSPIPRQAQLVSQFHLGAAVRQRAHGRGGQGARRLAAARDRADAERQPALGLRPRQPLAVEVGAVVGAGARAGPAEPGAGADLRERRDGAAGSILRPGGLRPPALGDVGNVGRNAFIGPTCGPSTWRR